MRPTLPSKATRVAALLVLLAVVAMWGSSRQAARRVRTGWERPVTVAVLVLGEATPAAMARLVEPSLSPVFPQRQAELMVGEVPLGPARGRLPRSADELGVGPVTAAEIGWLTAAAR